MEVSSVPRAEGAETESKLPPLFSSRPLPLKLVFAGLVPAVFGALCGWVLGISEVAYTVLAVPVAIVGGAAAGFEHTVPRQAAIRGLIGGALFGGFILIVHELIGNAAKAKLPDPPVVLAVVTALGGSGLGALGAGWRRDAEAREGPFLDVSELSPAELLGSVSSLVLVGSLWLPWFSTSGNPNSKIDSAHIGANSTANGWQTFTKLDVLLVLAATAPFVLSWIIARRHALTWAPGEVTMVVGITAFVLILCNGIILGKPDPGIEISLSYGYFVGLVACVALFFSGYLRQAVYTAARKPPGVL